MSRSRARPLWCTALMLLQKRIIEKLPQNGALNPLNFR